MFWRHATPDISVGIILVSGRPTIFCNVGTVGQQFTKSYDRGQRYGGISKRQQLPFNPILMIELFDVWGIDFMGPFVIIHGKKYILLAVDYVSN